MFNHNKIKIEEVNNISRLEDIKVEWRMLADNSSHLTPYVTPQYLLPWMRMLDKRYTICFILVWDDGELIGLAPLVEKCINKYGMKIKIISFPEQKPSPPCDILVGDNNENILSIIMDYLLKHKSWDSVRLSNMDENSKNIKPCTEKFVQNNLSVHRNSSSDIYYIDLKSNWDEHLAARSQKMRQNLRRGLRYCERLGDTCFSNYPGDISYKEAVDKVFHVVKHSWKNDEGSGQNWNKFLKELLDELENCGDLQLRFLNVNDEPIACILDMLYKNNMYALFNAYDVRYQAANAGQVMFGYSQEEAFDINGYRYVLGFREYLRQWTEKQQHYLQLRADKKTILSTLKIALYDFISDKRTEKVSDQIEIHKKKLKQQQKIT